MFNNPTAKFLFAAISLAIYHCTQAGSLWVSDVGGCDAINPVIVTDTASVESDSIPFFSYKCGEDFNNPKNINYIIGLNGNKYLLKRKNKADSYGFIGEFSGNDIFLSVTESGKTRFRSAEIQFDDGSDHSETILDGTLVNTMTPVNVLIKTSRGSLTIKGYISGEEVYESPDIENKWPTSIYGANTATATLNYEYPEKSIANKEKHEGNIRCEGFSNNKNEWATCAQSKYAAISTSFMKMTCKQDFSNYAISLNGQHVNLKKITGGRCDFPGKFVEDSEFKLAPDKLLKIEVKAIQSLGGKSDKVLVILSRGNSTKSFPAKLQIKENSQ